MFTEFVAECRTGLKPRLASTSADVSAVRPKKGPLFKEAPGVTAVAA